MNSTTSQMGITDLYYCPPDDFNFTLYGSYAGAAAGVLSFQVDYCTQDYLDWKYPGQGMACRSKEEADAIIGQMQVTNAILTQHFDQNEFNDIPVKNIINADLYYTLTKDLSQIYYYKIS